MKDLYEKHHKLVATWIPRKDFEHLEQLAKDNKVTLAAYVRAVIVDVLQEEASTIQTINSTTELKQSVV